MSLFSLFRFFFKKTLHEPSPGILVRYSQTMFRAKNKSFLQLFIEKLQILNYRSVHLTRAKDTTCKPFGKSDGS